MRGFSSPARWTPTSPGPTEAVWGGPAGKHSAGGWAGQQWSGPGPRGFLASATAEQREEKSRRPMKRCRTGTMAGEARREHVGSPRTGQDTLRETWGFRDENSISQASQQPTGSPSRTRSPHSPPGPRRDLSLL